MISARTKDWFKGVVAITLLISSFAPELAHAALTTNLEAYWNLDESSGNVADSTANNNILTNSNSTAFATAKINNGADFEANSSNYFSKSDATQAGLDITGNLTIAFWIKPESLPASDTEMNLVTKWYTTTSNRSYRVRFTNPAGVPKLDAMVDADGTAGTQTEYTYNHSFSVGTFYHVCVAYTAATPKWDIYVNGSAVSTTAVSTGATSIFDSAASIALGTVNADGTPTLFADGIMDEVGIWSRALDATECSQLYNGGAGLAYPLVIAVVSDLGILILFGDW